MNEQQYIDATNLAKLRIAYTIIKDCLAMRSIEKDKELEIRRALRNWIDDLESRLGS